MRTIYRAENLIDAHLVKGRLEQEGIPAHVQGEYLLGGIGQLPVNDLLGVQVAEHDVVAAERVLQELARVRGTATAERDEDARRFDGDPEPAAG